ncbi:metal-dependent hydrolase [Alkalihalobacterium chitinilyticum]|uniref:Metal-dependent hydrolase n=1 Tax=Alkalihalobacterium chitinilyticum TaxID=2980103 RepID=A0ABT5VHW0_9BACI|nr:metal-dependent hydrolase [Alkalihalobacterium chitinilyticum]MDE5414840.1 metal-dependent hydrolase [Alkalihalobacterium chitinilyticum]
MDSITHTLFGLAIYGGVDKREMSKPMKRATLFTAVVGSHIPDIDVISQLWDTEGQYQMWHRGITHSLFMIPVWALLLIAVCYMIWGVKDRRLFYLGLLAVFIHNTSDIFNAWGTGYLEPFSSIRLTFGTIPIIDFVIWGILLIGFLYKKFNKTATHQVYHIVGAVIVLHVALQSFQGYVIYQQYEGVYEQHTLSASFVPWNFSVIGKNDKEVEIIETNLFGRENVAYVLESAPDTDLEKLFKKVPEAKTLYEWSPFVVIVDDDERIGVYDPRFYRNGQSFLFEYIEK